MPSIPMKVADRIAAGVKKFKPLVAAAKAADVGEADTVNRVIRMLTEVFGYDPDKEITAEYKIKSTFCDLAVKLDDAVQFLIEGKAIGAELKDDHVAQATNYAANHGIDWVVLTNAETWRTYRMIIAKPIDAELVFEFKVSELDPKSDACMEMLYTLTKEGWQKAALTTLYEHKKAMSRYCLAAAVLSDPVLKIVRRELRRLSPDVSVNVEEIRAALEQEVIKRDVLEGEKADAARKNLNRVLKRASRASGLNEKKDTP